mgnify:CR=1 FL=1
MKIIYSKKFQNSLANIVDFIAQDSPKRAREFATNLKSQLETITFMPYKHRKNFIANDENIRDFIFNSSSDLFRIFFFSILDSHSFAKSFVSYSITSL